MRVGIVNGIKCSKVRIQNNKKSNTPEGVNPSFKGNAGKAIGAVTGVLIGGTIASAAAVVTGGASILASGTAVGLVAVGAKEGEKLEDELEEKIKNMFKGK